MLRAQVRTLLIEKGSAVWCGDEFLRDAGWKTELPDGAVNCSARELSQELASTARSVKRSLEHGSGVALVSGWSAVYTRTPLLSCFLSLAATLGRLHSFPDGRCYSTIESSNRRSAPEGYRSASNRSSGVQLHTELGRTPEPPKILGLLCESSVAQGGLTLLASGAHVHNEMLHREASTAIELYAPLARARHPEAPNPRELDYAPVFRRTHDGVEVCYPRYWLNEGLRRQPNPQASVALSSLSKLLESPGISAQLKLEAGDALFINNNRVLHGRTAFSERGEGGRRRLVRVLVD